MYIVFLFGHQGSVHLVGCEKARCDLLDAKIKSLPVPTHLPLALPSLAVFMLFLPPSCVLTRFCTVLFRSTKLRRDRVESQSSFLF